ncbi:hypothetical protein [Desulfolucanica intricata]|uniref:hypothetical protein n=1 Tax=Desulfolucanica intricata TaxID=1285191 RepID=UPI000836C47E|nr:hypothetical protein [Desulfolucanica intricata]
MGKIKSALELAMEKIQNLNVSEDEIEKMEYVSKGRAVGARFLDNGEFSFEKEFSAHPERVRPYLSEGAQETLLNNILLPESEEVIRTNKKAMEGIMQLKEDQGAAGEVMSQIEHLFHYYAQALQHTLNETRNNFMAKKEQFINALKQQYGGQVQGIEQIAFRDEWQRAKKSLNAQYEPLLQEQKQKIRQIK